MGRCSAIHDGSVAGPGHTLAGIQPAPGARQSVDRKSTRLNSSHTVIYTLSLHDALPILMVTNGSMLSNTRRLSGRTWSHFGGHTTCTWRASKCRSEEHTSELQSHSDLHSFPTRRSSDLDGDKWVDAQQYTTAQWQDLVTLWRAYNLHLARVKV